MKIAIYGRNFSSSFNEYIVRFFKRIDKEKIDLCIHKPFFDFIVKNVNIVPSYFVLFEGPKEAPSDIDFLISIGGDGTFLESMLFLKSSDIPVVGLNTGRLGFLANISCEEIDHAIDHILEGKYNIEHRDCLRVESDMDLFDGYNFALNEVTVQKTDSSLINIDAWINGEFVNTYWTDGLIISTPTGSTAYSLSVGGPIVAPGSNNIILTPIASHNLFVRPMVVHDDVIIKLDVTSRSDSFLVTVDNRNQRIESNSGSITIRKSKFRLQMLKFPFNNYYATLRNRLMWGMDKRN